MVLLMYGALHYKPLAEQRSALRSDSRFLSATVRDTAAFGPHVHLPGDGGPGQLVEEVVQILFNDILRLSRLKDLLTPGEQRLGDSRPISYQSSEPAIRPPKTPTVYERDIAAILQEAKAKGTDLHFQPIFEAIQARGHRCCTKTVRRYPKKMERAGLINRSKLGYRMSENQPPSIPPSSAA
jgi:hypothetical protein